MKIEPRRPERRVPDYSLTGDLLSFLSCRLQYRYHNRSSLPPSRPVQLWYGEFLHGTLELCFKFWSDHKDTYPFPWPCTKRQYRKDAPDWELNDIGQFADMVEKSLLQQGKQARSTKARDSAYYRIERAVNYIGPHLFPLIHDAEKKVIGTRDVPPSGFKLRSSSYEVHGVIDVLTNLTLNSLGSSNLIKNAVFESCPEAEGDFEVIVDYKGTQRPPLPDNTTKVGADLKEVISEKRGAISYWEQHEWQIQTYAWLRNRQPNSKKVIAGVVLYINELSPGDTEMKSLRKAVEKKFDSDVLPEPNSSDEQVIRLWQSGQNAIDQLSEEFLLRRAIRVIPITQDGIDRALNAFDTIVQDCEERVIMELESGDITETWSPNCNSDQTCVACDFRHFCPNPAEDAKKEISTPRAP